MSVYQPLRLGWFLSPGLFKLSFELMPANCLVGQLPHDLAEGDSYLSSARVFGAVFCIKDKLNPSPFLRLICAVGVVEFPGISVAYRPGRMLCLVPSVSRLMLYQASIPPVLRRLHPCPHAHLRTRTAVPAVIGRLRTTGGCNRMSAHARLRLTQRSRGPDS
jgi:hypothetical protein